MITKDMIMDLRLLGGSAAFSERARSPNKGMAMALALVTGNSRADISITTNRERRDPPRLAT
jgi:hypothetical protein